MPLPCRLRLKLLQVRLVAMRLTEDEINSGARTLEKPMLFSSITPAAEILRSLAAGDDVERVGYPDFPVVQVLTHQKKLARNGSQTASRLSKLPAFKTTTVPFSNL